MEPQSDELSAETAGDPFAKAMAAAGLRPFDDTDTEMQALMESLQKGGGCGRGPHDECPGVRERLVGGGDRLARYLVGQFEQSPPEEFTGRDLYLEYLAFTESETAFDYLVTRLKNRANLSDWETGQTIKALGYMGDERVIDEVIPVFAESANFDLRADVVRAVVRTMERSGSRPSHAAEWLQALGEQPDYQHYVNKKLKSLGMQP